MKIYPIHQTPISFRANNNHAGMKRYCEPRTGVCYYYDSTQFEKNTQKDSVSKFFSNISNKLSKMSEAIKKASTPNKDNSKVEDLLWL